MNIREKIIISFLAIITLFLMSTGSLFLFHQSSLREYKDISRTLTFENSLSAQVDDLLQAHSQIMVAPKSAERVLAYEEKRNRISATFDTLDTSIVNEDSRVAYRGLKNTIMSVLQDLDQSQLMLERGDLVESNRYHVAAVTKKQHVDTNTTTLVVHELSHLQALQADIEEEYVTQLLIVSMWTVAILLMSILYAFLFARKITTPIKNLSRVSQRVAAGDHSVRIDADILQGEDEVSNLARAFNTMLEELNKKICEVEEGNRMISQTKKNLEEQNAELEKFNKLMIGRELKMLELKNELNALQKKCQ